MIRPHEDALSRLAQGLVEVFDKIGGVLQANRQSQETFRRSCSCALDRRPMFNQAFHPAETGRARKNFRFSGDRHRCVTTVVGLKGEHSTEQLVLSASRLGRHLLRSDFMSRMQFQPGIMDTRNFWMPRKKISDFHCIFRMCAHPPGKRAHAAQDQPAIERRGDSTALILNAPDTYEKIALSFRNDNSSEYVAMTAEIFCCRM